MFAAGEEVRPQLVLRLVQLRRKDLLDAGPVVVLPGRVAAPRRLRGLELGEPKPVTLLAHQYGWR